MDRNYQEETPAATDEIATGANKISEVASNNSTDRDDKTTRFLALFQGYERKYGTYEARKPGDSGKVNGRAQTVKGELTAELIDGHLTGDGLGIGVVPLREDNTCMFGVIDVDIQGQVKLKEDLGDLEKRIRAFKMPLVICRSKSGGAHLYLFMREPIPATLMKTTLENWAAMLGYAGCEVFPKQVERTSADDVGNWINLPYFKARATPRYALIQGRGVQLGEFLDHAESFRVTAKQLEAAEPASGELFADGPPCLQSLAPGGFPEGTRNEGLFNVAVYFRMKNPDGWEDDVRQFNQDKMDPPLPNSEVRGVLKSAGRKEYWYGCSKPPLSSCCNKKLCYTREFGIGNGTPAEIEELNSKHFVVLDTGKLFVMTEKRDEFRGRQVLERSSSADIKTFYCNQFVPVGANKSKPLGQYWFDHPERRTYDGIIFDPTGKGIERHYNLWRGWGVEAIPGDWSLLQDHIRENICRGDIKLFDYVMGWLARIFQQPDKPGEVALVLKGRKGTGKSILGRTLGKLIGQHYVYISSAKHLTGNFNQHLRDAVVVFADEAFWAGDKQAEGTLKALITEPVLPIEGKGQNRVDVRNMIHLLIASNNDWVAPASFEERRFCITEVGEDHMQDKPYFAAIEQQLENGGYQGMLHDLLHRDLSSFKIRDFPHTDALLEQKLRSFDPVTKWWFGRLQAGALLPEHDGWESRADGERLHGHYADTIGRIGIGHKSTETELGLGLRKMLPAGWPDRKRRMIERRFKDEQGAEHKKTVQGVVWAFPSLSECRAFFDQQIGGEMDWPEETLSDEDEIPF
jgi:hypothetical protein